MNAEQLRDAITSEMLHYVHTKHQQTCCQPPYNLRRVTDVNCYSEASTVSTDHCSGGVNFPPSTNRSAGDGTTGQSASSVVTAADSVNDAGLAGVRVKPQVPRISAAAVDVDGNSVEMHTPQNEPSDVTMLSARSVTDADAKLKDEICQQETSDRSSDWTDTNAARDNCTDANAAASVTQPNSNLLVVDTNPPLAADAKARIKAALLNSGRRRQRLGEYCLQAA